MSNTWRRSMGVFSVLFLISWGVMATDLFAQSKDKEKDKGKAKEQAKDQPKPAPKNQPAPAAAPEPAPALDLPSATGGWSYDESLAGKKNEYFGTFKSGSVDSDRAGLDKFFENYYFARWTLPTQTGNVQGYAKELLVQDFKDIAGNAREYLLKKSFETLGKMALDGKVTATGRYNAILTIGSLCQRESANRNPPVPYAAALPFLLQQYESKQPDYIRLGALTGMVRHSVLGIADAEQKNKVSAAFLKTVLENKPDEGVDPEDQELFDWFRLKAMDGLAAIKSVGAKKEVVDALLGIVTNGAESMELRCYAAKTLGDLDYAEAAANGVTIDFLKIGSDLIDLAKAMCDQEIQTINAIRDKEKAKTGGASTFPTGTLGPAEADPSYTQLSPEMQQEIKNSIQRIKTYLDKNIIYTLRGTRLTGTASSGIVMFMPAEDPMVSKVTTLGRAISDTFKVLDDGPPEAAKTDRSSDSFTLEGGSPSSESGSGARAARSAEDKPLKVNLLIIRNELQGLSGKLGALISGGTG